MREIYTEIQINASAETIWDILLDFESYPEWNPFVQQLKGEAKKGGKLKAKLGTGDKPMEFTTIVQEVLPQKRFSWKGKLFIKGLFDGKHIFELERTDNGVKFTHREEFSGILVWLILKMIGKNTKKGFELMNKKLKQKAEAV